VQPHRHFVCEKPSVAGESNSFAVGFDETFQPVDVQRARRDAVDRCLAEIRRQHGKADWFKRHESPEPPQLRELQFAGCDSALDRLVGHFINGDHDLKTVASLLSRLCGRDLTRSDVQGAVQSLLDGEFIFGCALSPEDRATIKSLVARPEERIPRHLEPFRQIRRMRSFVRKFGSGKNTPPV